MLLLVWTRSPLRPLLDAQEMSFVASDMALEIIGDVAIVWFLSPQLRLGSLPSSGVARWTRSLPASAVQVRAALARWNPPLLTPTGTYAADSDKDLAIAMTAGMVLTPA